MIPAESDHFTSSKNAGDQTADVVSRPADFSWYISCKAVGDRIAALVLLVLTALPMVLLMILVKLTSRRAGHLLADATRSVWPPVHYL